MKGRVTIILGFILFSSLIIVILLTIIQEDETVSRKSYQQGGSSSSILNDTNGETKVYGRIITPEKEPDLIMVPLWDSKNNYGWQVGKVKVGEKVRILSEGTNFHQVSTNIGVIGFCKKEYIQIIK